MAHHSDDVEVLRSALNWLQAGEQVALVTVVRTWGSSPRPPGCLMAMTSAGKYVGSVSGGCVEEELLSRFRDNSLASNLPALIDFGVDSQQASRMGLPCGGQLKVLVEDLTDTASIQQLLLQLEQGELTARRIDIESGQVELLPGEAEQELILTESAVIKNFGPAWQLLIIGNGQIASHLARMALQLDYHVVICDPRDGYESLESITGVHYSRQMPDESVNQAAQLKRTAIVALAHDPRQDDLALTAAMESEAFYIGALGSRRSAGSRLQRLRSLGYSEPQLERIHGPVGLDIGSKRPAEIAVSILAHITAVRNGITGK